MDLPILFAITATVLIGTADFFGAIGSKQGRPAAVAGWSQAFGIVAIALPTLLIAGEPTKVDVAWGAASGVAIGLGLVSLYRGFAVAPVGIVAPTAAVVTVLTPVVLGLVQGDRPTTAVAAGIVLGVIGVALVSWTGHAHDHRVSGLLYGLAAGIGFGLGLALLANTATESGLWPLFVTRFTSTGAIVAASLFAGWSLVPHRASWAPIAGAAAFGAGGMAFFALAITRGELTTVGVITALFPAVTVALATVVLRERMRISQSVGVVLTLTAIALIAMG